MTPLSRAALACLSFALAAACASVEDAASRKYDGELQRLVDGEGLPAPIAAAALAVRAGDRLIYAGAAGCAAFEEERCARPFRPDTKVRVASISKMTVAMGVKSLVDEGALDLDRDVSDYLGWPLVNPAYPDRPITARQLLSHTSSIRDPEEYWVAAPGSFRSLFEKAEKPFAPPVDGADVGPGSWFAYANLNYGALAGVIEGATGERFDQLMTARVFRPLGLDVGFNWSGVTRKARADGGALPAREEGKWIVLVDGPAILAGELPHFLAADGLDRAQYLAAYRPGDNPTLFSPQGGLRASVIDLAALVSTLTSDSMLSPPAWRYDPARPNGDTDDGFYRAFGLGVQTAEGNDALLADCTLIGHSGEAYGLHSGAWLLKADPSAGRREDIAFAFVATGIGDSPPKGAHPTFNAIEERLVRLALAVAEAHRRQ